jgi:hypothetical protein
MVPLILATTVTIEKGEYEKTLSKAVTFLSYFLILSGIRIT